MTAGALQPGVRILLTRAADDCAAWAEKLRRAGAVVRELPCIDCEPLIVDDALNLGLTDWLVFTSRRGVEHFDCLGLGAPPQKVRVATVGPATARAARDMLGRVDVQSEVGNAESLARSLMKRIEPGETCLLPLAANADDRLEVALASGGAVCRRVNLYRTVPAPPREPRQRLSRLDVDCVFLASPSAVAGFVNQVEVDAAGDFISIGPSTSAAARAAGLSVAGEAKTPGLRGLIEAMP